MALDNIVARTHLAKALKHAFPMNKEYLKILSLASFDEDEPYDKDTRGMFDDIKMMDLDED